MSHLKELEEDKIIIRSLLISFKDGCTLTCFKKEYQKMIGNHLPFKKFGYKNEIEYLKAIPDVVRISYCGNDPHLMCVPDEKSIHIHKLVSKQKPSKHKLNKSSTHATQPMLLYCQKKYVAPPRFQLSFNSKKNLLPEKLRSEAFHLVSKFSIGLKLCDFLFQYHQYYKREFSFKEYGFSTLNECLQSIPQLIMKRKNNDWVIYSSEMLVANSDMECERRNYKGASTVETKESIFLYQGPNSSMNYQAGSSRNEDMSVKREKQVMLDFDYSNHDFASKRENSFEVLRISENMKNNLRKIIERNTQGIWATEFPSIYKEITNKEFDLHGLGYYDLASFINAVPDILVQKSVPGNKKDWLILPMKTLEENELSNYEPNISTPKVEGLPTETIITNIRHILQGFPEGILMKEFWHVYSKNCPESLDFIKLGFDCIENFLNSIANYVPLTFQIKEGCKRIFLTQTEETKTSIISFIQMDMSLPPNAASPYSEYTQLALPEDLDLNSFFPVYVCSVINPWHMYIQLKGKDCCDAMVKLYNVMEAFYMGPESKQYQIKTDHIKSGIICMALWPIDHHWYRAKVLSVPAQNKAKVFYVDYGTIQIIPQTMLRYIRKDFVDLPTQAIKACLAFVYPLSNKNLWSPRTKERILQLSQNIPLMAKVENIIDGMLSVVLCDTNGDTDIFINDILLNEGLARAEPFVPASPSAPAPQPPNPEQIFNLFLQACNAYVAKINSNSAWQANQNLLLNPSTIYSDFLASFQNSVQLPNFCPLIPSSLESTSTSSRCASPISNYCCDVFDDDANIIFDEFCQKVSTVTKRYVKRITTGDAYMFHILIHNSKPYVSSGDISSLIWSNKEFDYLQQRLQNIESNLDSIALTEDDNALMFEQFERFHVKGWKKMNNKFCLIVYPLSSVIHILNIFGHPSAELRKKILNEIEVFNPLLPKWQELSEIEIPEKEEESYGGTDDDQLNRLCLYDLLAMKEGIRIRRLKLKSTFNLQSMSDEEEKLSQLYKRVVERINEIKHICSNFE